MLKLKVLTMTHFSYAETGNFDLDTFQACCNWCFSQQLISAILKLTILITAHSSHSNTDVFNTILFSHAKTTDFDNNTFQPC
jgi:hypothetical protein